MHKDLERGQGLVEYAMILIIVAVLVIVLLAIFGGQVGHMFSTVVLSI